MKTETVKLSQIQVNGANPRTITDAKFQKLVTSLLVFPKMLEYRPIVVDETMTALGGNMRLRALTAISEMTDTDIAQTLNKSRDYQKKTDGEKRTLLEHWAAWRDTPKAPILRASELTDAEQREFIIKDNVGYGEWDMDALANEWDAADLTDWGLDVWDTDQTQNGDGSGAERQNSPAESSLFDRFIVPPFSILDTRKGYWQERKKMWRSKVSSENIGESRENTLIQSPEILYKDLYQRTKVHRKELGIGFKEYIEKYVPKEELEREQKKVVAQGTSLFDPVLAEIIMRWFCLPNGRIIDPFGGEQTKGIVAGNLGMYYRACEIRQEQVDVNNKATEEFENVKYFCGDSNNIGKIITETGFDLCFTSPPYYDLEVYSKEDMSALGTYEEFMAQYENIFRQCVDKLSEDGAFLVVKISEIRDKKTGAYRNFVGDNIALFKRLGLHYYNELILVEQTASTALRASRYMGQRKVGRTHQNVLVFYKGDLNKLKDKFKPIEFSEEDVKFFEEEMGNESEEN